jgi:hypothetical protein
MKFRTKSGRLPFGPFDVYAVALLMATIGMSFVACVQPKGDRRKSRGNVVQWPVDAREQVGLQPQLTGH